MKDFLTTFGFIFLGILIIYEIYGLLINKSILFLFSGDIFTIFILSFIGIFLGIFLGRKFKQCSRDIKIDDQKLKEVF